MISTSTRKRFSPCQWLNIVGSVWKFCLASVISASSPSLLAQSYGDDFDDSTRDPGKWGADLRRRFGQLYESNDRLSFQVPVPSQEDSAFLPWRGPAPMHLDWEASVTVFNNFTPTLRDANSSVGIQIQTSPDPTSEVLYIELYAHRGASSTSRGFLTALENDSQIHGEADTGDLGVTPRRGENLVQRCATRDHRQL